MKINMYQIFLTKIPLSSSDTPVQVYTLIRFKVISQAIKYIDNFNDILIYLKMPKIAFDNSPTLIDDGECSTLTTVRGVYLFDEEISLYISPEQYNVSHHNSIV